MEREIKTASSIFRSKITADWPMDMPTTDVIEAMEEYASQFKDQLQDKERENEVLKVKTDWQRESISSLKSQLERAKEALRICYNTLNEVGYPLTAEALMDTIKELKG